MTVPAMALRATAAVASEARRPERSRNRTPTARLPELPGPTSVANDAATWALNVPGIERDRGTLPMKEMVANT